MDRDETRYTEMDVLRVLEKSTMVLDHAIATCTLRELTELSGSECQAINSTLTIVSRVLRDLGRQVVPGIVSELNSEGRLWQPAVLSTLSRLKSQSAVLQLLLEEQPKTLN